MMEVRDKLHSGFSIDEDPIAEHLAPSPGEGAHVSSRSHAEHSARARCAQRHLIDTLLPLLTHRADPDVDRLCVHWLLCPQHPGTKQRQSRMRPQCRTARRGRANASRLGCFTSRRASCTVRPSMQFAVSVSQLSAAHCLPCPLPPLLPAASFWPFEVPLWQMSIKIARSAAGLLLSCHTDVRPRCVSFLHFVSSFLPALESLCRIGARRCHASRLSDPPEGCLSSNIQVHSMTLQRCRASQWSSCGSTLASHRHCMLSS